MGELTQEEINMQLLEHITRLNEVVRRNTETIGKQGKMIEMLARKTFPEKFTLELVK